MGREVQIEATEPQARFYSLQCRYPLFVAGFGAGKSEAMATQAILDASHCSSALVALYEPTYDLIRMIMAPRIQEKLSEFGVAHTYNKSDNVVYTSSSQFGDFVLRTLDNPSRIVGYESYRSHIDEIDTLKPRHAEQVWNKVIARNRQKPLSIENPFNRVSAYTTPEGFRFAHKRWVELGGDDYDYIQASTTSNKHLPDNYIQSLRDTYPTELIDAYIEGKFVNLQSGTVYSAFDRQRCNSNETIQKSEPLYIGQDFNIGKMASVIYVKRGDSYHAVSELVDLLDTPALIDVLKSRYEGHRICIYPDASGASRKTVNASTSDIAMLRQAGFTVRVNSKNPAVRDRIMAVNNAFEKGLAFINARACPETVKCVEQQAYDKNGEPDKKSGFDHQVDAAGYPIAHELPIVKPPSNINIAFPV